MMGISSLDVSPKVAWSGVVVVLGDVVMTLFVMVKKKKGCGRKGLKEEEEDGFVLVFTRCYFYLFFFKFQCLILLTHILRVTPHVACLPIRLITT